MTDKRTTTGSVRADFSFLRYAQCWEDADVLLGALEIGPDHVCLSIASAGDNALSMLSRGPARVIAVDLNPAQLAAVALRVSAYRNLEHGELLTLIGSRPPGRETGSGLEGGRQGTRTRSSSGKEGAGGGGRNAASERADLYQRCRSDLDDEARAFWDTHPELLAHGIGSSGKFENYFRLFRDRILPFVHSRRKIRSLLEPKTPAARERFYRDEWNSYRWRILFRVFFSRTVMGRLGRDPAFFDYVEGSVSDRILGRVRHALTHLEPADNPYVHWILTGSHGHALPHALREENFGPIRENLDRFEWHQASIGDLLDSRPEVRFDRFNLSDIFEYMSEEETAALLRKLVERSSDRARLAYWNMLAPRNRPDSMADRLVPLKELADRLHLEDKAFFYSRFVVEEAQAEDPRQAASGTRGPTGHDEGNDVREEGR